MVTRLPLETPNRPMRTLGAAVSQVLEAAVKTQHAIRKEDVAKRPANVSDAEQLGDQGHSSFSDSTREDGLAGSALQSKTTPYGNVVVSEIKPEDGLVHVPIKRLQQLLAKHNIDHRPAFVGFDRHGRYYSPIIDGVVISEADKPKLDAALAARSGASNANSLTSKQIAKLQSLGREKLILTAIEALHALNRRAKKCRDNNQVSKKDEIYRLKDRFLDAAIRAGIATIETFEVPGSKYYRFCCPLCEREWNGPQFRERELNDVSHCRGCDCYDNEVEGELQQNIDRWYVIACLGYRFHQPRIALDLQVQAISCEPHDPNQPQREIPICGLTIEAQRRCVELAIACLTPEGSGMESPQ